MAIDAGAPYVPRLGILGRGDSARRPAAVTTCAAAHRAAADRLRPPRQRSRRVDGRIALGGRRHRLYVSVARPRRAGADHGAVTAGHALGPGSAATCSVTFRRARRVARRHATASSSRRVGADGERRTDHARSRARSPRTTRAAFAVSPAAFSPNGDGAAGHRHVRVHALQSLPRADPSPRGARRVTVFAGPARRRGRSGSSGTARAARPRPRRGLRGGRHGHRPLGARRSAPARLVDTPPSPLLTLLDRAPAICAPELRRRPRRCTAALDRRRSRPSCPGAAGRSRDRVARTGGSRGRLVATDPPEPARCASPSTATTVARRRSTIEAQRPHPDHRAKAATGARSTELCAGTRRASSGSLGTSSPTPRTRGTRRRSRWRSSASGSASSVASRVLDLAAPARVNACRDVAERRRVARAARQLAEDGDAAHDARLRPRCGARRAARRARAELARACRRPGARGRAEGRLGCSLRRRSRRPRACPSVPPSATRIARAPDYGSGWSRARQRDRPRPRSGGAEIE